MFSPYHCHYSSKRLECESILEDAPKQPAILVWYVDESGLVSICSRRYGLAGKPLAAGLTRIVVTAFLLDDLRERVDAMFVSYHIGLPHLNYSWGRRVWPTGFIGDLCFGRE